LKKKKSMSTLLIALANPSNNYLISMIIEFIWAHLLLLTTQLFSLALILRIIKLFIV